MSARSGRLPNLRTTQPSRKVGRSGRGASVGVGGAVGDELGIGLGADGDGLEVAAE